MGDSGSMDSGRPDTPDTDESSEVGFFGLLYTNVYRLRGCEFLVITN